MPLGKAPWDLCKGYDWAGSAFCMQMETRHKRLSEGLSLNSLAGRRL